MYGSTTLWTFETANFRVELRAEPEDMNPEDHFEFADDVAFASDGDPAHWFCAHMLVTHKPTGIVLGDDYLGGCSYRSFDEFVSSHRDTNPMNRNCSIMRKEHGNCVICHYFPDMVSEAIASARANLSKLAAA